MSTAHIQSIVSHLHAFWNWEATTFLSLRPDCISAIKCRYLLIGTSKEGKSLTDDCRWLWKLHFSQRRQPLWLSTDYLPPSNQNRFNTDWCISEIQSPRPLLLLFSFSPPFLFAEYYDSPELIRGLFRSPVVHGVRRWLLIKNWEQLGAFLLRANQGVTTSFLLGDVGKLQSEGIPILPQRWRWFSRISL